jgi:hypothetical protein
MAIYLQETSKNCALAAFTRVGLCVGFAWLRHSDPTIKTALVFGTTQLVVDVHIQLGVLYAGRITRMTEQHPTIIAITIITLCILSQYGTAYFFNELGYHIPSDYLNDVSQFLFPLQFSLRMSEYLSVFI